MKTFSEFSEAARRTGDMQGNIHEVVKRLVENPRLARACLGLAGEVGEVTDLVKKWFFHGHALDHEKLKKEIGDVLWYVDDLCAALGVTLDDSASAVIAKLKARYPQGFSEQASQNRKDDSLTFVRPDDGTTTVVAGNTLVPRIIDADLYHDECDPARRSIFAIGDFVQFACEGGSVGRISALIPWPDDYVHYEVTWQYGLDARGEPMTAVSRNLTRYELSKITEAEFNAVALRKPKDSAATPLEPLGESRRRGGGPCLDPDKINGVGDQFPGSDFEIKGAV